MRLLNIQGQGFPVIDTGQALDIAGMTGMGRSLRLYGSPPCRSAGIPSVFLHSPFDGVSSERCRTVQAEAGIIIIAFKSTV